MNPRLTIGIQLLTKTYGSDIEILVEEPGREDRVVYDGRVTALATNTSEVSCDE